MSLAGARSGFLVVALATLGLARVAASAAPVPAPRDPPNSARREKLYRDFLEYSLAGDAEALERVVASRGETGFLAFEQAHVAGRQGDRVRMLERARRAVELDPNLGEAHALLARVSFRLVEEDLAGEVALASAIEHADAAVRLGAADADIFDSLATAHGTAAARAEARGDIAVFRASREAQRAALQAWADRLDHDLAYQRLAELARESDDDAAEARALRAVAARDSSLLAPQRLVDVLRRLGRCDEAMPILERAIDIVETDRYAEISLAINLGECAVATGQPKRAEIALRRAIELDPTNLLAASSLADALWMDGRRDEALASFAKFAESRTSASGERISAPSLDRRLDLLATRALEGGSAPSRRSC